MRKQIKTLLGWLHLLFIFTMILPVIYMIGMERQSGMIFRLYIAGYLLLLPIAATHRTIRVSKTLPGYLLICFCTLAGTGVLGMGIGKLLLSEKIMIGYVLFLLLGAFMVMIQAYLARMQHIRRRKAEAEMDLSFRETKESLEKPRMPLCFLFVCIYVAALNFACPEVCNLALFSTVFYLLTAISYQYTEKTEGYLSINDSVCKVQNIPYKRIFGIGKYFLISYLVVILLAIIPALFTVKYREYKDIREWILEREVNYEDLEAGEKEKNYTGDPMDDVTEAYGPPKELPLIVRILFYSITAVIFLVLIFAVVKWIREEMADYAEGIEESGDKIEKLTSSDQEETVYKKRFRKPKTEAERIRQEYRSFIKKHRKDRPAPFETPSEIEMLAGVSETEKCKELHEAYEFVRYGDAPEKIWF